LILLATLTSSALADDVYIQTAPPPVVEPVPVEVEDDDDLDAMMGRIGIGVTIGGGVAGFTEDTLRDTADDGGNWDVRATIGTRSMLAFEASYIGSAQDIDALGLDDDAILLGNGAQGALRFNATTDTPLQPFLFGGLAWRRYELVNADRNVSDVAESDNVLEIPLGVGVAYRMGGFLIDARGEYRIASQEDMIPAEFATGPDDNASMHRYGVQANVGFEF
jgi:hypothetical protein